MQRYTVNDFNRDYSDDDTCLEWLKNDRFPQGITCKNCERVTKHHRVAKRHSYSCDFCGNHVHPTAGTIFEKSTTSLRLWFYAIYIMSSTRCGISAKQLERELGVTYKTAWRMFKQIRSMLNEDGELSGKVEIDETYVGGKRRGGKRGRGSENKTAVLGMVERKGKIHAQPVSDVSAKTLTPIIRKHILPDSMIYTDELPSYNKLNKLGYEHKRIHHATNTIEGFWSLLKRGIGGVYHAVSAKYLPSYVNEYAFRYNHRNDNRPMFVTLLGHVSRTCSLS